MRTFATVIFLLFLATTAAADTWLLKVAAHPSFLVHSTDAGERTIAKFDDVKVYGRTPDAIAVIAFDWATQSELVVFDRGTEKITARWHIDALPASQETGATEEIALVDGY